MHETYTFLGFIKLHMKINSIDTFTVTDQLAQGIELSG